MLPCRGKGGVCWQTKKRAIFSSFSATVSVAAGYGAVNHTNTSETINQLNQIQLLEPVERARANKCASEFAVYQVGNQAVGHL